MVSAIYALPELSNAGADPVMQAFSVTFPGKTPPTVL